MVDRDLRIVKKRAADTTPHPAAHALSMFRMLADGRGRQYSAVTFPRNPWQGCEHTIRMATAVGWIKKADHPYAVLDVLDVNGDIVQDFSIPDALAFRQLKRKLKLVVEMTDGAS